VPLERAVLGDDVVARTHPVQLWRPDAPAALIVATDGEGAAGWARRLDAAATQGALPPLALVGIDSAGLRADRDAPYDPAGDPRARAYLPHVDPPYFRRHLDYVFETVLPWAGVAAPLLLFGCSNGAAWAAAAGVERRAEVAGVAAFSLGVAPRARWGAPPHALVSGRREPGFDRETTRYAGALRRRGVPVRARRPDRGHDHAMWEDEFVPAVAWLLSPRRCPRARARGARR
jgi:enterochelin esterase-like enzyme